MRSSQSLRSRDRRSGKGRGGGRKEERTEESSDRFRDGGVGDSSSRASVSDDVDVQITERSVEYDLKNRVERNQHRAICTNHISTCSARKEEGRRRTISITRTDIDPNHDHRDTSRQTHEDQSFSQILSIRKTGPGEGEHEEWGKDPVDDEGEEEVVPDAFRGEEAQKGGGGDAAQDWPHHHYQTDGCA